MRQIPARADLAVSLGAFLLVVGIGNAHGGYFPTAWGWCVLVLAWVAALALIDRSGVAVGRLGLAFLTALVVMVSWIALSILWSSDLEQSVLEVQRGLVYVVGVAAAVLVVRSRSIAYLLAGLLAGIVWVSAQALATRLVPPSGPADGLVALGRLSDPIGYYNALGLFVVIGVMLAVGFAIHGRSLAGRAAAAAALPVLLTTGYYTFSRGAELGLVIGFAAAVVLDGRRLRFLTSGLIVLLPAALALLLASGAHGLSSVSAPRSVVADEGQTLALMIVLLSIGSTAVGLLAARYEALIRLPRAVETHYAAILACGAIALAGGVVGYYGGPGPLIRHAHASLNRNEPTFTNQFDDLNGRLNSIGIGARVDQWRAALREHDENPWIGSGAGTHEQYWVRYRTTNFHSRDAHSIYLENLAELGWPGLAFVLVMLAMPFAGIARARRHPLAAGAFGAYAAFVVHAGIDWDWEVPAVTLVALLCAAAVIAAADEDDAERLRLPAAARALALAAIVAVTAFSLVGLVGNRALADASDRVDGGEYRAGAQAARKAVRWAPWSARAYEQLGRAQVGLGDVETGRANLRKAANMNTDDWRIWYDLGIASSGRQRQQAFVRAATLNPLEPDIQVLRDQGYRLPSKRPAR